MQRPNETQNHFTWQTAWFCLFGRKFSRLKIDAFPRLEASLNNELSKPPPQPSHPVARFCRANFTWPFLLPAFDGAIEA
ncbi:hypothetical protein T02_13888 [Trichinella nativa]|uniref:Uncharacterized protein n=2 Tax=Trichinella TaxID=6333 RepID=A0A0V1LSB9_9BILA|nr:hypothetical protein T03_6257 [Trichinella britovi]KRZ62397.1 hypothetical protein T02_13888 [Trichinella nativa]